jgi:hypothetical protein
MEILANSLIFFSALILLVNLSPRKFWPKYKRRIEALEKLDNEECVITENKQYDLSSLKEKRKCIEDSNTLNTLINILKKTKKIGSIEGIIIGISVHRLNIDFTDSKTEISTPVKLIVGNKDDEGIYHLTEKNVVQLAEVKQTVEEWDRKGLNILSGILLVIGFGIQLFISILC